METYMARADAAYLALCERRGFQAARAMYHRWCSWVEKRFGEAGRAFMAIMV